MCGRYAASKSTDELVEELVVEADLTGEPVRTLLKAPQEPPAGLPDYNIAPMKAARVVLTRARREKPESGTVRQMRLLTWGLVPSWSKDPSGAVRMINARAETVLAKGAFRSAALARRCLVPASGWYEWQRSPVAVDAKVRPLRQPFFIYRADGGSATFAGLYEFWRDPAVERDDPAAWLTTFAIITTAAEPGLDRVHDRQPLVLDPEQWSSWLDPALNDPDAVAALLATHRPGRFHAYPVGRSVGGSRANGPGLLRPLDRVELVGVVDPMTGEIIGD